MYPSPFLIQIPSHDQQGEAADLLSTINIEGDHYMGLNR